MITEKTDLFQYFGVPRKKEKAGFLVSYRHGQMDELRVRTLRPAVLIIPGGAYAMNSEREAEPVALEFMVRGFDAFVLYYDVAPVHYPAQIEEAAMAMTYIRKNAEKFGIFADKIAALGFSAGGHLLGCISCLWDDPAVKALFGENCGRVRPDASVFCYPVVSCDEKIRHGDSFANFCGGAVDARDYSIEEKVRPSCSPAFIWANTADNCVPAQNALRLYGAYLNAGVPAELHVFREGWHGMSVCNEEVVAERPIQPVCAYSRPWLGLCETFLKTLGFTVRSV